MRLGSGEVTPIEGGSEEGFGAESSEKLLGGRSCLYLRWVGAGLELDVHGSFEGDELGGSTRNERGCMALMLRPPLLMLYHCALAIQVAIQSRSKKSTSQEEILVGAFHRNQLLLSAV